jgi:hypothetical protein
LVRIPRERFSGTISREDQNAQWKKEEAPQNGDSQAEETLKKDAA